MRKAVRVLELEGTGPRVAFLPGLGARGTGFLALARAMSTRVTPLIVDYPEGPLAARGARSLAAEVHDAIGPVAGVVASSFGGMVAAHLAETQVLKGIAFLGSFSDPRQLGWRGPLIPLMGPIATWGRPGPVAAAVAAMKLVRGSDVAEVVPMSAVERASVWHRAMAIPKEKPPSALRERNLACVAIHGARDVLVPVSVLPRLAADLPNSTTTHVLTDAGHVPYFTHVPEVARLLHEWSRTLRTTASAA